MAPTFSGCSTTHSTRASRSDDAQYWHGSTAVMLLLTSLRPRRSVERPVPPPMATTCGPRASERFCSDLRRFAAAKGNPGLYHETVTLAFLFLIRERTLAEPESFDDFAARNPDLLCWKPSALARYYKPETLESERARHSFLLPDRLALP